MKLGWLVFEYAPTELKLSRAQRREARQRTRKAYRTSFKSILIMLSTATVLGVVVGAALMMPHINLGRHSTLLSYVIIPLALAAFAWLLIAWACRAIYVRANRQALREMGFAVCLGCGYDLRGLGDAVRQCPECGALCEATP